ncbi:MAG: carboxypeptidase regulatory-like domain-containing protein, partial [Acidobacteria bacterium]|nr:carboxypeptidase regulatory-like domain-containing protein [Acidobacteriota bacterium]
EVELLFQNTGLSGTVVDEDGEPIEGARVEEVATHAFVVSDADGRFEIRDLDPGAHGLLARLGDRRSEVVEAIVSPERASEPLVLVLSEHREDRVEVLVRDPGGSAASSIVILADDHGAERLQFTRQDDRATFELLPPNPGQVRAAALVDGRWVLGRWTPLETALEEGLVLVPGDTGSLQLTSESASSFPMIVSETGWNVTGLLGRVAAPPILQPGTPMVLSGLPEGTYQLQQATSYTTVAVRSGEVTPVELP